MDDTPLSVPAPQSGTNGDNDRRQLDRRIEDRYKIERTSVRSLLALLLGGIGIALGLIALWLQYRIDQQVQSLRPEQVDIRANVARLREELAASEARLSANSRQLQQLTGLTPRVADLTNSMDEVNARMNAGRRPWIAAEARYLIAVANRSLTLNRDVAAALAALEAAEQQLQTVRDPDLNGVKRALVADIQALQAVRVPDLSGIAVQLAAAEQTASGLPVLGAIADRYRPESTEEGSAPGFARAWQLLRSSMTNMISVRRIGKDAVELVSLEEQALRRHHLQLLLFFARTAATRGDQTQFQASIGSARTWLAEMFDPRDAGVATLHGQLQRLSMINIAPPLPNISGSLRLLDPPAPSAGEALR